MAYGIQVFTADGFCVIGGNFTDFLHIGQMFINSTKASNGSWTWASGTYSYYDVSSGVDILSFSANTWSNNSSVIIQSVTRVGTTVTIAYKYMTDMSDRISFYMRRTKQ